jgi:hypothetical protein
MGLIGLKFCGGCNPVINRAALVQEIEKLLPNGFKLSLGKPTDPWEKAILVCGCLVACANYPEVKALARHWILISGPMIDLEMVAEDNMAAVIVRKMQL